MLIKSEHLTRMGGEQIICRTEIKYNRSLINRISGLQSIRTDSAGHM